MELCEKLQAIVASTGALIKATCNFLLMAAIAVDKPPILSPGQQLLSRPLVTPPSCRIISMKGVLYYCLP
jgi:hypothetical protein